MKIHLGCGWRDFGPDWVHIDNGDYNHLDYKTDVSKPLPLGDNVADLIYASHVIAYFDREQIKDILKDWYRVLKPGGIIRLATPDFYSMIKLYSEYPEPQIDLESILGPLYGRMSMGEEIIYHKTTYDFPSLKNVLEECGFGFIKRYDWRDTEHSEFDDHSQAYIPHMDKEHGVLISLNVEGVK
jgi:ubiquinone/menaquinone biosynthesis C-methylase UbiE